MYDIDLSWVAFPLHPETPEEGTTLQELFKGRGIELEGMKARLMQVAREEGLPFGPRDKTYNSRLAQELGKWAESKSRGKAYHDAVFRGYFAEEKNIGKISELVDLAGSLGLPEEEARKVLEERSFKELVDRDWQRCYSMGVNAVPTFLIGGQFLVGAVPYETLEKLLIDGGVSKRQH
jgi:predicted DsbA family dithiol-disulfide isomerase